jgi:hypothetical protein
VVKTIALPDQVPLTDAADGSASSTEIDTEPRKRSAILSGMKGPKSTFAHLLGLDRQIH